MWSITLLGALKVSAHDYHCTPTAPRALETLATLVMRANRIAPISLLIDELWRGAPPRSASTTAQTYIYQIRKLLDEAEPGLGCRALRTTPPGYSFIVPEEAFDLFRFRELTAEAEGCFAAGRLEAASTFLNRALRLWTGDPLCNVVKGTALTGFVASLEEQYTSARNMRIEADLHIGKFHHLVSEMQELITESPYCEWYHQVLMFSLAALGRRHEALNAYSYARRLLAEDLGLTPCAGLRRLQDAVLSDQPLQIPAIAVTTEQTFRSGGKVAKLRAASA
jgi:SARP family transcriptional regulator, regulator of embCAB operon